MSVLREAIIDRMRRRSESPEEAAAALSTAFSMPMSALTPVVEAIRREGSRNMLLDTPSGVIDSRIEAELGLAGWYTGPEDGDEFWPKLRDHMESGSLREALPDIDRASTKVVALCADPTVRRLKKRGLVVGYVQSGKTANYTAVMAKAADAGYQLFIVLAGMHNNLRRQTQVRLSKDLIDSNWAPLTTEDADFGTVTNGSAMLSRGTKAVAVVKKNQSRLRSLRQWLRDIPEEIRAKVPIIILDDEADQATPNSATRVNEHTRINELIRDIWAEVKTGTYLGYTATPFANVFMDPSDDEELYPSDFIIDLPRPDTYFGAEAIFGREPLSDEDTPDDGLDVVRDVPDEDAAALKPPTSASARAGFNPVLPQSLTDAVAWFLVATAIRAFRGQSDKHSSMLVHTTHYTSPHFSMKELLGSHLEELRTSFHEGEKGVFKTSFEREISAAREVATKPSPMWTEIEDYLEQALSRARVVVDNGSSDDRLDYDREDEDGTPIPETVIAVGGGTLSRGLTLEGLVVSYFIRTSNTYDTLLQMGRWFGFRPGYEDLPRIWMPKSLADEFRFLALVEEEIREDMRRLEKMQVTPKEMGIRVRQHPGRLAIVAKNKMQHADVVKVSYSGRRLQTFILHETDQNIIAENTSAAIDLITYANQRARGGFTKHAKAARWLARDIPSEAILGFLSRYEFHPDLASMRSDHISGWIRSVAIDRKWNIVVKGSSQSQYTVDGEAIDLGTMDLGLDEEVPTVSRAPLSTSVVGTANLKSLLVQSDWYADLDRENIPAKAGYDQARDIRRNHAQGNGLLIIYAVSKSSIPLGRAQKTTASRRKMNAPQHLVGLGLIFPDVDHDGIADQGDYYSVHPDWEVPELDEDMPDDTEETSNFDGQSMRSRG